MPVKREGLYIVLLSIHGLIRGKNPELGRDADTGGQVKYVVELARSLGQHEDVARVDLLTRLIIDPAVSEEYANRRERLGSGVNLLRFPCGKEVYLPKEQLWDSLDNFSDTVSSYLREQSQRPDLIHSHYADAGYVGSLLSRQLSIPLVHTGHSLGRSKRHRLLASGLKRDEIERIYNMSRRIEAEEICLSTAECVITSTHQEIEEQYGLYDFYRPEMMRVIPPGTDLNLFFPPHGDERDSNIAHELKRFLRQPDKPIILAISRPDLRKNIGSLLSAYGECTSLQEKANLVIVAGNRDDVRTMDVGSQKVLTDILYYIDLYDLYGKVAYPKHHTSEDVSVLYRLAALSQGVFANPALIEPFGLTLIEAAATGLPIVATVDGGPQDIIANCQNGFLVDPLNPQDIACRLLAVIEHENEWQKMSQNGIVGVIKHYSWPAHVDHYLHVVKPIIQKSVSVQRMVFKRRNSLYRDRTVLVDLDQCLIGETENLNRLVDLLRANSKCCSFGIATGRRLDSALKLIRQYQLPRPDVLFASLGTEIYYSPQITKDVAWQDHIDHQWRPNKMRQLLGEVSGLQLQPKTEQSDFKISYYYDAQTAPAVDFIRHLLLKNETDAQCILSCGQFLDILPLRASKGLALRWYAEQWGLSLEHILVAGGSGADEDMLRGNTLGVVVASDHSDELSALVELESVYFAKQPYAAGIMEAIDHYQFLNGCNEARQ
ncbi:MAG: glycosyltransferase [Nitrosomonas sp.]|nr:glycosyltransferase [Nitrosomonas sp.]MBP6075755.1 glycosyltransferase [Nitrosomonas sp.]